MLKRFFCVLCVLALLLSLAACGSRPTDIMDQGASQFSLGKSEDDYSLKHSGDLLDELIDNYSGSFIIPEQEELTDDEFEDMAGESGLDKDDLTPDNVAIPTVSNREELARVIFDVMAVPAETVTYRPVNGYVPNYSADIDWICCQLERWDPIIGTGVDYWSSWNNGSEYVIFLNYSFTLDEVIRMRDTARDYTARVARELERPGMSDYERCYAVNEYLCDTVYYPPNEPYAPVTHSVYGALVDGCAVCEGYACAAAAIIRAMGGNCDIEVGPCGDGYHAWNLALVDGNWYQLDVCWNDGGDRQMFFLVTDAFMLQSRSWEFSDWPATPSLPYSP